MAGNLPAYERDRLGFLAALPAAYGALASFDSRTTVVNDFGLAREIVGDSTGRFEVQQNFLGHQLDDAQVESTLAVRKLLNPGLRPSAVGEVAGNVALLTRRHLGEGPMVRTFEPLVVAERILSEAFSWHLFGTEQVPFLAQTAALLNSLERTIGNVFAPPAAWRSPTQRRIERQHRDLVMEVCALLADVAKSGADATEGQACGIERGAGGTHAPEALANLLIGAMLAAQRVPAAAAGWILLLVAQRPDLQRELHAESADFTQAVSEGKTVLATQFPLTLAVVHEALRLYPPTWLITRTSTTAVRVGGYAFPPRHMFMISPYVLHRDERAYEAAESFDPARWMTSSPPADLSFGLGRHRCPGANFTVNALAALLLTVGHDHHLSPVGTVTVDPRNTLKPAGLTLMIAPRVLID